MTFLPLEVGSKYLLTWKSGNAPEPAGNSGRGSWNWGGITG
jgi:hypothetical protein